MGCETTPNMFKWFELWDYVWIAFFFVAFCWIESTIFSEVDLVLTALFVLQGVRLWDDEDHGGYDKGAMVFFSKTWFTIKPDYSLLNKETIPIHDRFLAYLSNNSLVLGCNRTYPQAIYECFAFYLLKWHAEGHQLWLVQMLFGKTCPIWQLQNRTQRLLVLFLCSSKIELHHSSMGTWGTGL